MARPRSRGPALATGLLVLLVAMAAEPLAGQALPGQPRAKDRWEAEKARYRADMLQRVDATLTAWREAWNEDTAESAAETYAEDGVLLLSDVEARGRGSIEEYLEAALPEVGPIGFSLTDFEVGGSVAMVLATFHYRMVPSGVHVTGRCLTVLVESDGAWKIRSQIFRPLEESGPRGP